MSSWYGAKLNDDDDDVKFPFFGACCYLIFNI